MTKIDATMGFPFWPRKTMADWPSRELVLNEEMGATILMVTHDAFTASCCRRVVFLRDGQIFLELHRDGVDRKTLKSSYPRPA